MQSLCSFVIVQDGKTALSLASTHGNTNVVKKLTMVPANINFQDKVMCVHIYHWLVVLIGGKHLQ